MLNLSVYRAEKRIFNFTIKDKSGNPVDISSANVVFKVTTELPPIYGTQVFTVDATAEASDGTCTVTLTNTETDIEPKIYYYELYVDYGSDEYYVAEVGLFTVLKRADATTEGKTYARPEDVRLKLRWISEEYDYSDTELQYLIEEAHRKMTLEIGMYETKIDYGHYDEDDKTYYLPHGELISFDKIYRNGEEVDEGNYTVDYDKGMVTFASSYSIYYRDYLEFRYVPYVYKDLEILYAVYSIITANYVDTDSAMANTDATKIEQEIKQLKTQINGKGAYGSVLDYSYRGGRW